MGHQFCHQPAQMKMTGCRKGPDQQQYEGNIFVRYPCSENASFPSREASPASPGLTPTSPPCDWVDDDDDDDGDYNDTDDDDDDDDNGDYNYTDDDDD